MMTRNSIFCNIFYLQNESNAFEEIILLIKEWEKVVHLERKFEARECQVYPIGSYALGVLDIDSDIDLVLVAPNEFSRETDFFKTFSKLLQRNKYVSDILPLSEAYVPIVKFKYKSCSVDIQFANYED